MGSREMERYSYLAFLPLFLLFFFTAETRDWNGNTPLHSAAASGNAQLLELIISLHPHYPIGMLNKYGTVLFLYLLFSSFSFPHFLLIPYSLHFAGDTALHLAAHVGSAPCVEVLMEYGAPINLLSICCIFPFLIF
jgi:ankyrin repeat protein